LNLISGFVRHTMCVFIVTTLSKRTLLYNYLYIKFRWY